MGKNDKKQNPADLPEAANAAPAEVQIKPDASKKYFFIFWGIIILAIATAWILAVMLPGVSESIIERWLMVGLAAALAVFLLIYR